MQKNTEAQRLLLYCFHSNRLLSVEHFLFTDYRNAKNRWKSFQATGGALKRGSFKNHVTQNF